MQPLRAVQATSFFFIRNIEERPTLVGPSECEALVGCNAAPAAICPFVSVCPDGSSVLLESSLGGGSSSGCTYAACGPEGAAPAAEAEAAPGAPLQTGAASMAAPAVVFTLVVVFFVEALLHFC